jgi:hypothetical protein
MATAMAVTSPFLEINIKHLLAGIRSHFRTIIHIFGIMNVVLEKVWFWPRRFFLSSSGFTILLVR